MALFSTMPTHVLRNIMIKMSALDIQFVCTRSDAARALLEQEPRTFERRTVRFLVYQADVNRVEAYVSKENGTEEVVKLQEDIEWFVQGCEINILHFDGTDEIRNFPDRWFSSINEVFLNLEGDQLLPIVRKFTNCTEMQIIYQNNVTFDNLIRSMRSMTLFYFQGPNLRYTILSLDRIRAKVALGDGIRFFLTTSPIDTTLGGFFQFITTVKLSDSYPVYAFGLFRFHCTVREFIEEIQFEPHIELFTCCDQQEEETEPAVPDVPNFGVGQGSVETAEIEEDDCHGVLFEAEVGDGMTETQFRNTDGVRRFLVSDPVLECAMGCLHERYRIQLFVGGRQCIICANFRR